MLSFCYDMLDHPPLYPVHPYLPCLFSHCVATPSHVFPLYLLRFIPLFASFLLALAIVFFTTSHSVVCLFFLSSVRIEVELLSGIK
jgi:hypothetical protein